MNLRDTINRLWINRHGGRATASEDLLTARVRGLAIDADNWHGKARALERRLRVREQYGTWDYWALIALVVVLAAAVVALLVSDPACVSIPSAASARWTL